jgi:hypothetical protein
MSKKLNSLSTTFCGSILAVSALLVGGPAIAQESSAASNAAAEAPPPVPSLFESTRAAAGLIPALDIDRETARALQSAGRSDPFAPLNTIASAGETLPNPNSAVPSLPPITSSDPASFARSVKVSGIVQIGGDVFALLSADGSIPEVLKAGDRYETATVSSVSLSTGQVVLEEGGQSVIALVPQ